MPTCRILLSKVRTFQLYIYIYTYICMCVCVKIYAYIYIEMRLCIIPLRKCIRKINLVRFHFNFSGFLLDFPVYFRLIVNKMKETIV